MTNILTLAIRPCTAEDYAVSPSVQNFIALCLPEKEFLEHHRVLKL